MANIRKRETATKSRPDKMLCNIMCFAFAASTSVTSGFKYDIEIRDPNIVAPCPEYPNNFLDKFVKMPDNITVLPDDTIRAVGDFQIIHDLNPSSQASYEFYKRERGIWQETVYSIKRGDMCTSFFDPNEVWGPYVRNIPAEQRKCPFKKGQIISVDLQTEQGFTLPSPTMAGEYWGHYLIGDKTNLDQFCCMDFYFNLYRV